MSLCSVMTDRCHGSGKAAAINRFGEHTSIRDLLMDALDGVGVRISGNENDRGITYTVKPPSDLNPFAASFEINVHQHNIGLIGHCELGCFCPVGFAAHTYSALQRTGRDFKTSPPPLRRAGLTGTYPSHDKHSAMEATEK